MIIFARSLFSYIPNLISYFITRIEEFSFLAAVTKQSDFYNPSKKSFKYR